MKSGTPNRASMELIAADMAGNAAALGCRQEIGNLLQRKFHDRPKKKGLAQFF
jgi:hypothetical protein